jgi:hypothetical protein
LANNLAVGTWHGRRKYSAYSSLCKIANAFVRNLIIVRCHDQIKPKTELSVFFVRFSVFSRFDKTGVDISIGIGFFLLYRGFVSVFGVPTHDYKPALVLVNDLTIAYCLTFALTGNEELKVMFSELLIIYPINSNSLDFKSFILLQESVRSV